MVLLVDLLCLLTLTCVCMSALTPDDIKDTLYEFCPLNVFVDRDGDELRTNNTHRPCCASCVASSCGFRAPCCPDKTLATMTSKCTKVLHPMVVDTINPYRYFRLEQLAFWMVSSCSSDFEGTSVEGSCLNRRIEDPFNITFVQPVLDSNTTVIYANIYCAICNGVDRDELAPEFFPPSISCFTDESTFVSSPLKRLEQSLLDGDCIYNFKPRSVEAVYENQCFQDIIDQCNVTGMWEQYDPVIEEACAAYDLTFISNFLFKRLYKNVHCYLCNGNSLLEPICREETSYFTVDHFTAMLGQREETANLPISTNDGSCSATKFWDPYKKMCRNLVCPGIKILTGSGCTPLLTSTQGLHWSITILWTIPVDESIDTQNFTNRMVDFAFQHINTSFYMIFENVSPLRTAIYSDVIPGDELWVVVETFFTSATEANNDPPVQFIRDFRNSQKGQMVYDQNGINLIMKGMLIDPKVIEHHYIDTLVFEQKMVSKLDITYDYYDFNVEFFTASITWTCDLAAIEHDEYSLSMYGSLVLTRSGLQLSIVEYIPDYENNRVLVCVEDLLYQEHKESVDQRVTASQVLTGISYVTTLLSLSCIIMTLIAFSFLDDMQLMTGKLNACLCVSVIISQCLQLSSRHVPGDNESCKTLGIFVHFFQIDTAAWVMVNVFQCLRPSNSLLKKDKQCLNAIFLAVCLSTTTILSGLFVAVNIGLSMTMSESNGLGYGGKYCDVSSLSHLTYLSFLPTIILLVSALVLLTWNHYRFQHEGKDITDTRHNGNGLFVFALISLFYWILKFLSVWFESEDFVNMAMVLNSMKGMWLFWSFVPSGKFLPMIAKSVCGPDSIEVKSDY